MTTNQPVSTQLIFPLSPLIRITLFSLYCALTLPLPFLSRVTAISFPEWLLWLAFVMGGILLLAVLSERVVLTESNISVTYPEWVRLWWRKGWSLNWQEINNLKLRTTGQGGIVYYFITHQKDRAYLLPMRVAGFAKMVKEVETKTGIDTTDIRPLAQPWMYFILFIFTLFLLLIDLWVITNVYSI